MGGYSSCQWHVDPPTWDPRPSQTAVQLPMPIRWHARCPSKTSISRPLIHQGGKCLSTTSVHPARFHALHSRCSNKWRISSHCRCTGWTAHLLNQTLHAKLLRKCACRRVARSRWLRHHHRSCTGELSKRFAVLHPIQLLLSQGGNLQGCRHEQAA